MNDIFNAFSISASGMYAQRIRMNTIASNLANYDSYTEEGVPFRRLEVVFRAVEDPEKLKKGEVPVRVEGIFESDEPFRMVYDPSHPMANEEGFVLKSNIDLAKEMVNMISALRSYEANMTAFNMTRDMAERTLELWK